MTLRPAFLTTAFLCLLPLKSIAEDSIALSRQFVDLLRYDEQYENNHSQCLGNAKTVPPESLLADDPEKFFGLQPGTPRWEQVIQAYAQYWETICSRPTKEEFLDSLAIAYRDKMPPPQLQAAIHFYSSDVGQKLITAHKAAAARALSAFSQAYSEQVPTAVVEFNRRLKSIAEAPAACEK
jgi:hypothetical protein